MKKVLLILGIGSVILIGIGYWYSQLPVELTVRINRLYECGYSCPDEVYYIETDSGQRFEFDIPLEEDLNKALISNNKIILVVKNGKILEVK